MRRLTGRATAAAPTAGRLRPTAPREDSVYLAHIHDAISRIQSYLDGVTEEEFLDTPLLQDGVIRQIQIIGEAAKRLSSDFRAERSEIPWKDVAGMRDKLVHDYMGIDLHAVWDTARRDIPALKTALEGPDESTKRSNSV